MLMVNENFYRRAALTVLSAVAVLILLTFRHYGITWDEELQSQYGQAVVDYYLSGFKDQRYAEIYNLYLYGGMFDGLAAAVDRFAPFTIYNTRHLLNACFGLLGLWGTWRLGRLLGGGATGLMALIFLTLTPMYYGHMFNNPKDIPFAAGIVWSLYYMAKFYRRAGEENRKQNVIVPLLKLGCILGLTLGVRVGGVMVLGFWVAGMGLWLVIGQRERAYLKIRRGVLGWAVPVAVIAYLIMLLCWPWAQQSPVENPVKALNEFKNFPHNVEVLLDGMTYMSTQLPWYYVPLYFGVQLPEFLLLLVLAGIVLKPWIWRGLDGFQKQALALVLLTIFVPVLYAVIRHPALYDAVRHFLFIVPLLCIFAALAAQRIFILAGRGGSGGGQIFLMSVFVLAAVAQIAVMMQLHPYEYIYANQFAGGVRGAYGRYELDYWGTSFKEAARKIQKYVMKAGGVPPGKITRIAICGPWDAAMIYLPPDYEPVVANQPADFFLSTTRWMCQNMRPGREIIRIERTGVPLSVVKDLR